MRVQTSETLKSGEGNFLRTPGKYHLLILETDETPSKPTGEPIDGFRVKMSVLNEGDESGKNIDVVFFEPKLSSKDGGEWSRAKITAFLVASGLVSIDQLGQELEIDLSKADGRQVMAEFDYEKEKDGKVKVNDKGQSFLQLHFANIYHIDDPRAKDWPKNAAAIKSLPSDMRVDAAVFEKAIGSSDTKSEKPAEKPVDKAAEKLVEELSDDDLGGL